MRKYFRMGDAAVIAAVLFAALLLLFLPNLLPQAEAADTFSVTVDGKTERYDLNTDGTLVLENGSYCLHITVKDRRVSVTEADCPDGSCMRMGEISRAGETVICVPAGVVIRIEGEGDFDATAG